MKTQPRQAEDGRLWTPGSVDFFRTINEQARTLGRQANNIHRSTQPRMDVQRIPATRGPRWL